MTASLRSVATRVIVTGLLAGLLAGCLLPGGGDDPDGERSGGGEDGSGLAEELGPEETLAALGTDADAVDDLTRRTAPELAASLEGRVRFANGSVESCEGGSFDGPTAVGYLVRARVDPGPGVRGEEAVAALADGLAGAGWEVSDPNDDTPGRVVVSGRREDAALSATVAENLPDMVLFTVAGPCRPVDDESRDDALGSLAREVIPDSGA